jgi:FeS assembly SUF system protein
MTENSNERDVLDVTATEPELQNGMMRDEDAFPVDNLPKSDVERPVYDQTQHSYFLNKFLEKKSTEEIEAASDDATEADDNVPLTAEMVTERIVDALKEIFDPEIPVNIYELGLIYEVQVDDAFNATVIMTLTTPHCPVAESMPGEVELRVSSVKGVKGAEVKLVWDPPWDMSRMSDEARLELGLL